MGRAEVRVKKDQEMKQKANILKPWENRPIGSFESCMNDLKGQYKFANDLVKKRK
ncbi:hypothetical protein K5V21_17285 [Clostridium sardiniense]|uniref:Uncharacterized protein n=1 Tax=Clostridium sardiniense TaxID=29369 RepID=A0ABS7L3A3_CLOSR|nr:hypothetical protein [Clostridium sardiniense]MBY0757187.1 hypothetical protein [Clostridium sardiniense]MDQ0461637.1 hypothetical protein [Clostridium sardiniense]